MNKQKNQIILLGTVLLVGILYVYIQYLFIPQWDVLKQQYAELTERQDYLAKLEESYKIFPGLKEQVLDLKEQASVLDTKVPKKMDKPGIMLTVYNLTKKNGLSPGNLNYEEIKDEGSYLTMGMTFSCTGSLENIYALLNQFLTDNPYILALDSINFSEGENGTAANMRLIAYVYKS